MWPLLYVIAICHSPVIILLASLSIINKNIREQHDGVGNFTHWIRDGPGILYQSWPIRQGTKIYLQHKLWVNTMLALSAGRKYCQVSSGVMLKSFPFHKLNSNIKNCPYT